MPKTLAKINIGMRNVNCSDDWNSCMKLREVVDYYTHVGLKAARYLQNQSHGTKSSSSEDSEHCHH